MDNVEGLAGRTGQEAAGWRTTLDNHTKMINAWGEQLNARFDRVDARLGQLEAKVDREMADVRFDMRKGFGKLASGQELITQLLNRHLGEPSEETPAGGADE